jgi:uncharacterized protein
MDWNAIAPALGAEMRELPVAALTAALAEWEATAPHLLHLLASYRAGIDRSPEAANQICYLLYLAAEREERRAFAPLCALLHDAGAAEDVLGDAIDETLTCLLVRTYDDDPGPLHALIEDAAADEGVRAAGLEALAWLTAAGRMPREATAAYLGTLFERMAPRGESLVWFAWQNAIAWLGLEELRDVVAEAFRREWITLDIMDVTDFEATLREAAAGADPMALLRREGPRMFDNAIAEMSQWAAFQEDGGTGEDAEEVEEDEAETAPLEPYINPFRNVGRNDPCPCGSGKKFKKCCLGKL